MATSSKELRSAKDSPADIKTRLLDARKTVHGASFQSAQNLESHTQERNEWKTRSTHVSRIISLTKSTEAREDLKILLTQAEEYRDHFNLLRRQEQKFYSSLSHQLSALDDAVQKFETMERRQQLKSDLAHLAGKAEIATESSHSTIDFSEINRIIHTAVALIELKEQKEVSA